MKQPKKLLRHQKEIISKKGYDWNDWMLLSETKTTFTIIHKGDKTKTATFNS